MNTEIVILSCVGTLMLVFNEPVGRALLRWQVETCGRRADTDQWTYRAPLILIGVVLTCMSFFYER